MWDPGVLELAAAPNSPLGALKDPVLGLVSTPTSVLSTSPLLGPTTPVSCGPRRLPAPLHPPGCWVSTQDYLLTPVQLTQRGHPEPFAIIRCALCSQGRLPRPYPSFPQPHGRASLCPVLGAHRGSHSARVTEVPETRFQKQGSVCLRG